MFAFGWCVGWAGWWFGLVGYSGFVGVCLALLGDLIGWCYFLTL